ncbi:MAG: hypothetical protein HY433_03875 [Candidatus Liptonbacteria bacterium]|nr:hypothetical protein [Candidatus Liptonbacteria bacterium]
MVPCIIWRDANGNRNVVYLNRNGERWILNFNWLRNDFNSNDRLVRPRNSLRSPRFYRGVSFWSSLNLHCRTSVIL